MTPAGARDVAHNDILLEALLNRVPLPSLYATDMRGVIVPMPDSVPISNPLSVIHGHSTVLELLEPGDMVAVYTAWHNAIRTGAAKTNVHLVNQPNSVSVLQLIDARDRFGVFLGFIIGRDLSVTGAAAKAELFRKRLCFVQRDTQATFISVDDAFSEVLGYDADELIGKTTIEMIHPDDRAASVASWMMMLAQYGSHNRRIVRYRHHDGSWHWFESTTTNNLNDPSNPRVSTELVDITDRMEAQEALRVSEQLHRNLAESIPLGILQITAARNIVYRNARFPMIVGCPDAATFDEQLASVAAEDRASLEQSMAAVLTAGYAPDLELTVERADGNRRCNFGMRALTAEDGAISGAIIWVADVTDPVHLREELEVRATYDALTKCHNRSSILVSLENQLHAAQSSNTGTALFFIDLNHFKQVNDNYGHEAGDALLRHTGACLLKCARAGDVVGRLGGDEFLIVSSDVATGDAALAIARRMNAALQEPILVGAVQIAPSASIGIAWTKSAIAPDAFVAQADAAMYESKRGGLGPVLSSYDRL